MLKLIIGAAVIGTVGYLGYKAYKSVTAGAGLPGAQTTPATPAMIQNEQAAGIAQKFLPGGYGWLEGAGGCMGCMGGAVVEIL